MYILVIVYLYSPARSSQSCADPAAPVLVLGRLISTGPHRYTQTRGTWNVYASIWYKYKVYYDVYNK